MHIVMLSDLETLGGAAVSASRLSEALHLAGQRVTRLVGLPEEGEKSWRTQALTNWRTRETQRWMTTLSRRTRLAKRFLSEDHQERLQTFFERRDEKQELKIALDRLRPDVINVHNIHYTGWSPDLLMECMAHAPTVWTLHDMWSFTGRCAYSYDCEKFITGCDASCPTPDEQPTLRPDLIAGAWRQRRRLFGDRRLVGVTPSRWLAGQAKKGMWADNRIEIIPYGLPSDVYRPVEAKLARETLGIKTPGPVLLVVAQVLTERRKGGNLLVEALSRVSTRPFTILTIGNGRLNIEQEGIHVHELGFVTDERLKILAYNAADILVHPAPVDNLPNVVLEAIACGTPVAAFPIGGLPDMVRPGVTGWLAADLSSQALAVTFERAMTDIKNHVDMRPQCRAVAEAEYGMDLQAERYLALYHSLANKDAE